MSTIPNASLKFQEKENALKSIKPQLSATQQQQQQQGQNENNLFATKKSLTRAPSSHLTLTKNSSKNALRTKSSNSITFQPAFNTRQQQIGGNFNKIRKTSTLTDINAFNTTNIIQDESKVGAKKFIVQRDSPISSEVNPRRKLNFDHLLDQQILDDLRQEAELVLSEDEIEVEFIPEKEPELPYVPDNMQPMSKNLIDDIFGSSSTPSKDSREFVDPLSLDFSHVGTSEKGDDALAIDFNDGAEDDINATLGFDSELELEFPELGEEDEAKKLDKLLQFYESGTKYKPSRI
ncbi:hypothetical protein CANARDRAFT_26962 [[Candida] arabinofermentans NRRL YB-2248]|uniref:Securin n=1 Tax=[Candida] arabinofermentans NRRL YB-2248 TaxID=983967 RepID=A0A1E4T7E7_9ASCO|nr:hypothetical protein CANARDRAFT_26962 [[Candida] arabinofermentans NRRL YB-2248]